MSSDLNKKQQDKLPTLAKLHADTGAFRVISIDKNTFEPETDDDNNIKVGCSAAKQHIFTSKDYEEGSTTAITQEIGAADKFVEIKLEGVSLVKIDILDTSHTYATMKATQPTDGTSAQLESAESGEFQIITIPTDSDSGDLLDGEQYCPVIFPVSQGGASISLVQVTSVDSTNHTVGVKSIILKSDITETPNYTTDTNEEETELPYLVSE